MKYRYKGNDYILVCQCLIKTGFWFWRKWRDGVMYKKLDKEGYYEDQCFVRTLKDFEKKFKPVI